MSHFCLLHDRACFAAGAVLHGCVTAHKDILESGGVLVKIPIVDTHVRSLNQSVSVGVGVFEALRQLDDGHHVVTPRDDTNNAMVRLPTPMMQHRQQQ